ncbi:hypothetical protein BVRB_8g194680 [Beta vulgaris subsp. vulgaris]|nr:hypothetical protein BVRB_8g194680 [Beta vulgaris subsp. vulgaris]
MQICCSSSCPVGKNMVFDNLLNNNKEYEYGFKHNLDSFTIGKGISEDKIRLISKLKDEPNWMLDFRLNSYHKFLNMVQPIWSDNQYPPIDFQDICYYSSPKKKPNLDNLDEVDSDMIQFLDKLNLPLTQKKRLGTNVAIDFVYDSESFGTAYTDSKSRTSLTDAGVIFCSMSRAVREYPDLIKEYLGKVVPDSDNYYAALNSAVFSDGSFCYIPKGVKCEIPLSTYFRINASETGQFERTLIVADEGSVVEYLEGCTAVAHHSKQLHAAVVELYAASGAQIKYSTVQNWFPGDAQGRGGIYNFVTKRGLCAGRGSKISWTQVETGSAITWKYPSVVLEGDESIGEFYSVAVTTNHQQADTGSKMIHKGKNTRSRIISKGISAGTSRNVYRGLVKIMSGATNARNSSQCDSMLVGDLASANTYPYIEAKNPSVRVEHEASTSRIGADQIFYFQQRGIDQEQAISVMINQFTKDVVPRLPKEFSAEANQLLTLKLERSVG